MTTISVANRIQNLPNYPFVKISADVRALQAAGQNILRLDMGSPDLPPPAPVIEHLAQSARQPSKHGYAGYRGIPAFRAAVARYYKRMFGVVLDPESEVLPLLGSKEGIMNLTLALVNPGDTVLAPRPGYPAYEMTATFAGATIAGMRLSPEHNYLPDINQIPLEVAQAAKLMWVNYPNNPTGALASAEDYNRLVTFCAEHDILLASDNPYFAVVFDAAPSVSALSAQGAKDRTVELMSLSKSHNMAGWRLGAAVGNADMLAALLRVKSNTDSGHFIPIYEAGATALDETAPEWLTARNAAYQHRRDLLLAAMDDICLAVDFIPQGALYLWARVQDGDDIAYCQRALYEAGVSIVPGSLYGDAGVGHVRISLTQPEERLKEGLQRLAETFKSSAYPK